MLKLVLKRKVGQRTIVHVRREYGVNRIRIPQHMKLKHGESAVDQWPQEFLRKGKNSCGHQYEEYDGPNEPFQFLACSRPNFVKVAYKKFIILLHH